MDTKVFTAFATFGEEYVFVIGVGGWCSRKLCDEYNCWYVLTQAFVLSRTGASHHYDCLFVSLLLLCF